MIKNADPTPQQKKLGIALATLFFLYALFGFIGAPFIVHNLLENRVAQAIGRQVAVAQVRVNPFTLSLTLRGLNVQEPDGTPFVQLDEAYANVQTSSFFKWALVLKSVHLKTPDIHLIRIGDATFNFSDIGGEKNDAPEPEKKPADSAGLALAIYEVRIEGGKVAMADRVAGVDHRIENFDLSISDFSSRPADTDVYTLFNLAARVNGADLTLEGKSRPFAPHGETRAQIGLQTCQLPFYKSYIPLPDNLEIHSLQVDLDKKIEFRLDDNQTPDLTVAGMLSLSSVRLADGRGDPFVNYDLLNFELQPSAVLTGQIRLARVDLMKPEVFLKRLPDGELYLPFLAVRAHEAEKQAAVENPDDSFQPVITVDQLNLKQGTVHFTDQSNSRPFTAAITDLDLEMENFGYNNDRTADYRLTFKTAAGESADLSGSATLAPPDVSGKIDLSDIQVSRYLPYYMDIFEFKAAEGSLSLGGNFLFRQDGDAPLVSLNGVYLNAESIKVVDEDDDEPLIALDQLQVAHTTADLSRREATLGSFTLSGMQIDCRREKDGTLNLVRAFAPAKESSEAIPAKSPEDNDPAVARPFVLNLDRIDVSDVAVNVEDRLPAANAKFRIDEIQLEAANLSTQKGRKGTADLALRWEQGGQIQTSGDVALVPLGLDLKLDVSQMDIRPFQPYISEQADLIVTNGLFSTRGRMRLTSKETAAPTISYTGKAGLHRFASIDRKNANDFLKWEVLTLDNLVVGTHPTRLFIDQVSLADFFARVLVDTDGSVNLVTMFSGEKQTVDETGELTGGKEPPAEPERDQAPSPSVRVTRVQLSNGDVDFSDRFIQPNFNAKFHDLGGRISGLESMAEKRADVILEGMWSNHAPVKISGEINPLIADPYLDLNLTISDIELSPFSPYSGKYLGHVLEKGKLTFDVGYLMENRRLQGKNRIFLDQLTLGDMVDSPEAVSLPIKLAVALLKDREGNIDLNLPVSGSLDDPEFKVGKVVLTVLKNLIVKIVSSPFAALGALAGGGEELGYLDFEAGVSGIGPENAEKLDKLAKILFERPELRLDIQGTVAPEADDQALRTQLLENRVKAEKLQRMVAAGQSAVPLEEVDLTEKERQVILEAVFADSGISPSEDDSGKPVDLTPETMARLLLTHTTVNPDEYRKLANARAFAAKNYLLENGQVARERVFIVEPGVKGQAETSEKSKTGQVVFRLK
jgi:hypothetical protein